MSDYQEYTRYTSVSVCTPAVRMVAIQSWAFTEDNGELTGDHCIHPVVAIEASVGHRYSHRVVEKGMTSPVFGTHRELIKAGWKYQSSFISTKAFIVFEGHLQAALKAFPKECTCALFTCEWPASADEKMLASEIEKLHLEAIEVTRRDPSV
jgi:hypothetical protein